MSVSLKGRSAIVTGAAGGLGYSYAKVLAEAGVDVAVCDLRKDIQNLPDEFEKYGSRVIAWRADVSQRENVQKMIDGVVKAFGRIDILVNNAGQFERTFPTDTLDKTLADYEAILGTNLRGTFMLGRAVVPYMRAQGGGDIVNISTCHVCSCVAPVMLPHDDVPGCPGAAADPQYSTVGDAYSDIYDASKWAINGLTLSWAKALRRHNIRVNAFCMGPTDTPMIRRWYPSGPPPEFLAMTSGAVARVLVELLEEGPEGRTGENINLQNKLHPVALAPPLAPLYVRREELM